MNTTDTEKATVLIVDDVPANVKMLFAYLCDLNFKVLIAQDGEDALAKLNMARPDLILMDVSMPKMDGFEACRRIKANSETMEIPVIFMTAMADTENKMKGFEVGAVDYITKPFQHEEVLARITAHLRLQELQKILKQQNTALEQKNFELQQQNDDLDAFARIVARDLKIPLGSLAGFTKILMRDLQGSDSLKFLLAIENSRGNMAKVIDDLLVLVNVRTQEVVMEAPDMAAITAHARQKLAPVIEKYRATIKAPAVWPSVWGYTPWITKVWEVYLRNGLEYGGRPPQLELGATKDNNDRIRFWVRDNGPGLSTEQQNRLFVPFAQAAQARIEEEGYGLNLSIVRMVVEKCGGSVGVDSQLGHGSTFYFTLPAIG
ncbi:MAG: response regulator [Gammaproteobacteria bacterium]|nr:response regulator [Gammaproteobacteria bacterium]